jgi:hypothetical protein
MSTLTVERNRFEAELRRVPGLPVVARALAKRTESGVDAILDSYGDAARETAYQRSRTSRHTRG